MLSKIQEDRASYDHFQSGRGHARQFTELYTLPAIMHGKSYTHIVVGAGSAGCVVAARIADKEAFNVLLLEAGQDCDTTKGESLLGVRDAPMKGPSELFDPTLDWNIDVALPGGGGLPSTPGKGGWRR